MNRAAPTPRGVELDPSRLTDAATPGSDAAMPGADATTPSDAAPARDGARADAGDWSIVGVWRETSAAGCVDEHRFTDDGRYVIASARGERIDGRYRWTSGARGARGELWVIFDTDNGGSDCSGSPHVETGASHVAYVVLDGSPDRAVLYRSPEGDDEWFRLAR